jgi:hypothetical protein
VEKGRLVAGRIRTGLGAEAQSSRELRKFAWVLAALILVFGGLVLPWRWGVHSREVSIGIAAVLGLWGAAAPASLGPVYRGWQALGHGLGYVNSRIILGILFFGIVIPTAVILRLLGLDPMKRKIGAAVETYRTPRGDTISRDDLERPF